MKKNKWYVKLIIGLGFLGMASATQANLSFYYTRVIYNEGQPPLSVNIRNSSVDKIYLAQIWVDNLAHKKSTAFMVLPPIQRIEAGSSGVVRLQPRPGAKGISALPTDRESLFYLVMKEIPSKEQIEGSALLLNFTTVIKLFYRPQGVAKLVKEAEHPVQKLLLTNETAGLSIVNPTPFYIVLLAVRATNQHGQSVEFPFKEGSFLIPPKSSQLLNEVQHANTLTSITLININDYGGETRTSFKCQQQCQVD